MVVGNKTTCFLSAIDDVAYKVIIVRYFSWIENIIASWTEDKISVYNVVFAE